MITVSYNKDNSKYTIVNKLRTVKFAATKNLNNGYIYINKS